MKTAGGFKAEIRLSRNGNRVNGKSILDVMTLVCPCGCKVLVSAEGDDAEDALGAIAALFQAKFGEV